MNNSWLYELGIALSGIGILILIPSLCICYNEFNGLYELRSRSKNLLLYRFVVCEFRGIGMNIIDKFIKVMERYMDNLSIKKKFIQLYIFCVFLPLIITDSVVLYIVDSMESQRQYHEMANVANAVSYNISALVENAGEIAKSMYTNRRMNTFLEKQYESTSDYYTE